MASVNNAPRYDSKVACITDHAGKQHQLRTGLKDPNEAAIAANVLEMPARRGLQAAEDMMLYSDVADLLNRLLARLRPRDYAPVHPGAAAGLQHPEGRCQGVREEPAGGATCLPTTSRRRRSGRRTSLRRWRSTSGRRTASPAGKSRQCSWTASGSSTSCSTS